MDRTTFTAQKNDSGRRLDRILRAFLKDTTMSGIYSAIRKGLVKVNGKKSKPETLIQAGDQISIADFLLSDALPEAPDSLTAASVQEFPVIFENEHLKFINKPYGISVHGENSLEQLVSSTIDSSLSFKSAALHRLDRNTTGLLAFSRSIEGARWFSENIKMHSFRKEYLAVLSGKLTEAREYTDYIAPQEQISSLPQSFHTMCIVPPAHGKEPAITRVKPVSYGKFNGMDITLALIEIPTGQKHQIRLQCAHHGFPLLGDSAYGAKEIHQSRRFYLHAFRLTLPENRLSLPPVLVCEPDQDFREFLKDTGIENQDFTGL